MTGPIDVAYVEFEAKTDRLERGALVAFDEIVDTARLVGDAVDRAFAEMTSDIVQQFERMRVESDANFDGLLVGVERVGTTIATSIDRGTEIAELGFDELAARAREDLSSVGASASRVSTEVGGMTSKMSTAISTMAGFVGGNVVMSGLSQAYQFAKSSVIGFNETLENSGIAFTTMLGDAQKAQVFISDLQRFAKETPFEFEGLVQNAQRMMGMGIAARDVIPDLRALGDSVASVGGSAAQVDQVTLAFDQMAAKGTLDMGNMNQLLQGGVPNALRILADSYKVTTGQMIEMISTGKVQSADALPKLISGIEHGTKSVAALGGMMDRQSRTMSGALSNISDGLQQAVAGAFRPFFTVVAAGAVKLGTFFSGDTFTRFGQRVSSGMSNALRTFNAFIHSIDWSPLVNAIMTVWHIITDNLIPAGKSAANTFGPVIMGAFRGLLSALSPIANTLRPIAATIQSVFNFIERHKTAFQALAASVLTIVAAMKAYEIVLGIVALATKVWTAAQVLLDIAMDANPVGLVVIAVLALAAGIFYLWTHSEGFRKFFIDAWNDIWGFLKAVGAWFAGPFAHFFIDTWNTVWGFFKSVGAWFAGPFVRFFVNAWHTLEALPGRIIAAVRALPGLLLTWFQAGLQRLAFATGAAIGTIVRFWLQLPVKIWSIITNLWNTVVNITQAGVASFMLFMLQLPGKVIALIQDLWNRAILYTRLGIETVINWVLNLRDRFISFIAGMWNTGVSLFQRGISAMIAFAQQLPGRLWAIISGLPGLVWNALSGLSSMLWNIGEGMIRGLINGISHLLGWAINQAKNAALNIAHGFMSALESHSPSRLFFRTGEGTVQGYAQGVWSKIDVAHRAVREIIAPAQRATANDAGTSTNIVDRGFSGTVVVNVGGRQVAGTIVDILYDNPQHVALAGRQGDRRLARR